MTKILQKNWGWQFIPSFIRFYTSQVPGGARLSSSFFNVKHHLFVDNCLLQASKLLTLLQVKPKGKILTVLHRHCTKVFRMFHGFFPNIPQKKRNSPVQKTTWDRFRSTPRKTNMTMEKQPWMKMYNSLFFAKHKKRGENRPAQSVMLVSVLGGVYVFGGYKFPSAQIFVAQEAGTSLNCRRALLQSRLKITAWQGKSSSARVGLLYVVKPCKTYGFPHGGLESGRFVNLRRGFPCVLFPCFFWGGGLEVS